MDIAILVMGTKNNPSTRNIEAFKNTVVDYCVKHKDDLQHNYKFVFYYADSLVESISVTSNETSTTFDILIPITESVHRTFEKTRTSLLVTRDIIKPDLYIRTNISTYINIPLLDKVAEQLNKDDVVFCNKIGTHLNLSSLYFNKVFPRGDLMIFNKSVVPLMCSIKPSTLICGLSISAIVPSTTSDKLYLSLLHSYPLYKISFPFAIPT